MILFEHVKDGALWRFEVCSHEGRTFCQWRKWFQKDGDWLPTKQGATFPIARLPALREAVDRFLKGSGEPSPAES